MSTTAEAPSLLSTLLSANVYKASQGRRVRQVTLAVLLAGFLLGCQRMSDAYFQGAQPYMKFGVPALVFAVGAWFAYRIIHWPRFADFLIAVQGELDKVNWATWEYLIRATGVVLVTMVIVAAFLWVCDFVWIFTFTRIGFTQALDATTK